MAFDKTRILGNRSPEGIGDRLPADHGGDGRVSTAQPLGDAENVRSDAERLGREHSARSASPGYDLVENQKHVMAVAQFAEDRKILFRRIDDAAGMADRLDNDRGHRRWIFHLDHILDDRGTRDSAVGVSLAERTAIACRREYVQEAGS